MRSRSEYLRELVERYMGADKKGKGMILNEYVRNTSHNRKYVIAKLNSPDLLDPPQKKERRRPPFYGADVIRPLKKLWEIFDFPCGQRLKPLLQTELPRLRHFGEIHITNKVAGLLLKVSPATIDRGLAGDRSRERRRHFSTTRPGTLLKAKIPVRLTDWDTDNPGYVEMDLVAHCGGSSYGEFGNTLSVTEIATSWWEGEAIMGKGQRNTFDALKRTRERSPIPWKGIDSDNGGEFINDELMRYCVDEKLEFTRSRPNRKNDNAYVEQKNWTHVRKILGYLRYDTPKELMIINDLYRGELRLYKNFFQPVMKLKKKERIGGKLRRQYEVAKTPYQRVLESKDVSRETKDKLRAKYRQTNPAALKRQIDRKLWYLYQVHQSKRKHKKTKGGEQKNTIHYKERRLAYG